MTWRGPHTSRTTGGRTKSCLAVVPVLLFALAVELASAQAPRGVYAAGEAAVTGFSGSVRPFEIAPGQDPAAQIFIDPDGPSLRVVDLRRMGGPPAAQLVGAPKPFTVSAKWIGQVFGVALDDASPANIYVAATSVYGLSIVAPGPDGRPQRVRTGIAGATFMPAQWGPGGGPGSIWKIDGLRGDVSLFANVAVGGRANSGPALGGLAYDRTTKSLFVADRETGLVHGFDLDGVALGTYDHGVAGRAAVGLAPVPAPTDLGAGPANAGFDSARPDTWGYAATERRVFGLATHAGRLYYAVAEGLRVWSVGLQADGRFAGDARIEVALPPAAAATEIAKIVFDDEGRMYLAERSAPTGAPDFADLSIPSVGRLLRYTVIGVTAIGQPIWQPSPDEYAVGFPRDFRNDNGGVAIGYGYDADGRLDPRACGSFVWTTGEKLRATTDAPFAAKLGPSGALAIDGLQGMPVWRIRRDAEPPWMSYFIDYADAPPDPSARGHMGDMTILRPCARGAMRIEPPPRRAGTTPPLPGPRICRTRVCAGGQACPVGQVWNLTTEACVADCPPPTVLVNGVCCTPQDLRTGGACAGDPGTSIGKPMCGAAQTAIGPNKACCDNDHIYAGPNGEQLCCERALENGKCDQLIPKIPELVCADCCAVGYVKIKGKCCLKGQATTTGQCCPAGHIPSPDASQCRPLFKLPKLSLCCASGFVPIAGGKCCAAANLTTSSECCPVAVNAEDRSKCPAKASPPQPCGPGKVRDARGACVPVGRAAKPSLTPVVPVVPRTCGPNERRDRTGRCVLRAPQQSREPLPRRPPAVAIVCPPGWIPGPAGRACRPAPRLMPPVLRGRPMIMAPPGRQNGTRPRRW
ncbi:hypothetical protein RA307_00130 [Xanthobacteraceae bacterium Astr-EGSB]|uniref:hypothetical protein n=1 Tax=Astrobacterium formosum TaxID=3069710 RepID=UPI0027B697B7|nr:hypothetical protein [Xanthobacteraceae bacterium Astr-EGSB]